jgi:Clp amino terminal domain, pathogenicity island component
MTPRSRKVAVFVGTAALAAGAGIGVASQGSSSAATEPRSAPGMMRGGGGSPSGLADALGVSETRLREAMDSLRQSGRPQDLAAALAEELGVSEDKVRDALESAMPQGGGGGAPPSGTSSRS